MLNHFTYSRRREERRDRGRKGRNWGEVERQGTNVLNCLLGFARSTTAFIFNRLHGKVQTILIFSNLQGHFKQKFCHDQRWRRRRNDGWVDREQVECALERRIQIDHEAGVYSQLISPSPGSLTKKSTPPDDDDRRD